MSNKRRRTNDYFESVASASQMEEEKMLLLDNQIRDLETQRDGLMSNILEKKFQELVRKEKETPLPRSVSIYVLQEIEETKYMEMITEDYLKSWDQIRIGSIREACALAQMNTSPTVTNMTKVGNVVSYPDIFRFRCVEVSEERHVFCFFWFSTTVCLDFCYPYDRCATLLCDLKSDFSFGDGLNWFKKCKIRGSYRQSVSPENLFINLERIAQVVFLSLVPHICGRAHNMYGYIIQLICEYVHYSEEPDDAYMKTVMSLSKKH